MRRLRWIVVLGMVALVATELVARYVFHLGNPPLSIPDETMEYRFAPDQEVRQFGNRQHYNSLGMRSDEPPDSGPRILVFGDSVVNGGNLIDQGDLASEVLAERLSSEDRPAFVGNVAAGSWGPANVVAWVDAYGFVGADRAVLVLNSQDRNDDPTFEPLPCDSHPTRRPRFASVELVQRYLHRYLPGALGDALRCRSDVPVARDAAAPDRSVPEAIVAFADQAATEGVAVCAVLHRTLPEARDGVGGNYRALAEMVTGAGIPIVELAPFLADAAGRVDGAYRDGLHLTRSGQRGLADALEQCLREMSTTT